MLVRDPPTEGGGSGKAGVVHGGEMGECSESLGDVSGVMKSLRINTWGVWRTLAICESTIGRDEPASGTSGVDGERMTTIGGCAWTAGRVDPNATMSSSIVGDAGRVDRR